MNFLVQQIYDFNQKKMKFRKIAPAPTQMQSALRLVAKMVRSCARSTISIGAAARCLRSAFCGSFRLHLHLQNATKRARKSAESAIEKQPRQRQCEIA